MQVNILSEISMASVVFGSTTEDSRDHVPGFSS